MEIKLTEAEIRHLALDEDLTLYFPRGDDRTQQLVQALGGRTDLTVQLTDRDDDEKHIECRANLVWSGGKEYLTGTFRAHRKVPTAFTLSYGQPEVSPWPKEIIDDGFLVPTQAHAALLFDYVLSVTQDSTTVPSGTVVIAGATSSGKTKIGSALVLRIARQLASTRRKGRFPHIVTIEDPLENWSFNSQVDGEEDGITKVHDLTDPLVAGQFGLCLTNRLLSDSDAHGDVKSVTEALTHARRQTTRCVYIGEVRDTDDWEPILEFGASGHLVIVTTHAASVRESASKIIASMGARTPARRREVLGCVRGIVHTARSDNLLFPSVWRGSAAAVNALVSVGLSSICPNQAYMMSRASWYRHEELVAATKDPGALLEAQRLAEALDVLELRNQ